MKEGLRVGYVSAIGDESYQHVGTVIDAYPEGIPSCREPMVKIGGKAGVVLWSHCTVLEPVTVESARRWLATPGRAVRVGSWCVKTVDELDDPYDKRTMGLEDGKTVSEHGLGAWRQNSFKGEIEQHPERCDLVRIDGTDRDCDHVTDCVCPFCGEVQGDDFEISDGAYTCDFCGQEFEMRSEGIRYFTTEIPEKKEEKANAGTKAG